MNRLPCRPIYAQAALVAVLGLVGLSLVVDAPAARAAPNLVGGGLVLALGGVILWTEPPTRPLTVAVVLAFAVGGVGLGYLGLAELGILEQVLEVQLITDAALLVGLGLFVFDSGPEDQ